MRVKATVTTVERVDVEVSVPDALAGLAHDVFSRPGWGIEGARTSFEHRHGHYITDDGFWELWEDTGHGSGLTTRLRAATEGEIAAWRALNVLAVVLRPGGWPPGDLRRYSGYKP